MPRTLRQLEREVVDCRRCSRLTQYIDELRERHPDYWCKPVPGFGDRSGWLAIVGLAPGLHGANKSGRPFYIDSSGEWLYGELARRGMWDERKLSGVYILNAVKCVPPQNKPTGAEQDECRPWLEAELSALGRARVVMTLGSIAHRAVLRTWGVRPLSAHPFGHARVHRIEDRPALLSSYHPSRQNTNTGLLTRPMWRAVFTKAEKLRT